MGLKAILLICGLLFVAVLITGITFMQMLRTSVGKNTETVYVYVRPNDSFEQLYQALNHTAGIKHPTLFKMLAKRLELPEYMKPGRYGVEPDMTAIDLINTIKSGRETPVRLTINQLRTMGQLEKLLDNKLMMDSVEVASMVKDSTFCATMSLDTATIKTLFIPDTYEVYWTIKPKALMEVFKKAYDRFWTPERRALADSIGLTPAEVATVASIVEEESAKKEEYAQIAGLYINRLHKGMMLQADPTVKYALQNFELRRITSEHLKAESPYNTYRRVGLPPAPIRFPQMATMDSVLHHDQHNYLYMCAKEDFSGYHNFAASYAEHMQNARRYQKALNERNIK